MTQMFLQPVLYLPLLISLTPTRPYSRSILLVQVVLMRRADRVINLLSAERFIARQFAMIEENILLIIQGAITIEKNFNDVLLDQFPLFRNIVNRVSNTAAELPPSGAMAGIYARVDLDTGSLESSC